MTAKELKSLKEGDVVIFIGSKEIKRTYSSFSVGSFYTVGGEYWREAKKTIKNSSLEELENTDINLVCVKKDNNKEPNGWRYKYFEIASPAAKVLYGKK